MATWPSAPMTQHLAASASACRAGSPPALPRTICDGLRSSASPARGPRAWSTQARTCPWSPPAAS
eukprot:221400-Alexandrium_andersonii.AAC.1